MKRILVVVMLAALITDTRGTHILGGEIKYAHVDDLTYDITIRFWTDLSAPADRPELILELGDGTTDTVPRNLIVDDPAGTDCGAIRYAEYVTTHTYLGFGTYVIRMTDQNRNGGIVNVPNSVGQPFSTSAVLVIDPLLGNNSSVYFLSELVETDWNWSTVVHDPDALDPDGDSLSFELMTPEGFVGMPVAGYSYPDQYLASDGFVWMDPGTGVFQWYRPNTLGEFVIAIRASEWRDGALIGQVTRDMTICIASVPTRVARFETIPDLIEVRTGTLEWIVINHGPTPVSGELTDAQGRLVGSFRLVPGANEVPWDGITPGAYGFTITALGGERTVRRVVRP